MGVFQHMERIPLIDLAMVTCESHKRLQLGLWQNSEQEFSEKRILKKLLSNFNGMN